jgi:hypothetical protein
MAIFQGAFSCADTIGAPLFDDSTNPSATLVLKRK